MKELTLKIVYYAVWIGDRRLRAIRANHGQAAAWRTPQTVRMVGQDSAVPSSGAASASTAKGRVTGFESKEETSLLKERAGLSKLPDLKEAEAVQKFFLEEITAW